MLKENHNPNQGYFNNPIINKHLYTSPPSPSSKNSCKIHHLPLGQYFCFDCITYHLCQNCLAKHQGHSVMRFQNWEEAKEATRQALLIEVEQTLNRLKGRQNQLKNQVEQVSLIRQKIKQQSNELVVSLRIQVDEFEKKIKDRLDGEFVKYEVELQNFYREYDEVNNYLRQNLLQIIDGEINIFTFCKDSICKDIDLKLMPNFGKMKQNMEKCKKYLKSVKNSMIELENSIKYFSSEEEKNQAKFDKYDRFLRDRTGCQSDYNSPLLRTLSSIEPSENDLKLLKMKVRA